MDQMKAIARGAAKYGFWIGCFLILAGSMTSWFLARQTLHKEFEKNQGDIKGKFTAVKGLQSKKDPPNEKSHQEMDKLLDNTLKLVVQAWQLHYAQQDAILRWPMDLKEDFVSAVRPLKPIEAKIDFPTPANQELNVDFRRRYRDYARNLLPRLAEIPGTIWQVGRNPTGGMGMMGGATTMSQEEAQKLALQKPPLVLWDGADQARLVGMHFDWSSQQDQSPTTLQVLYAQEDLWVLTALMYIIRNTNGQIESRHEAVVKNIETILIGRHAPPRSGQVIRLGGGGGMGSGMMGSMGDMGSNYMSEGSGGGSAGGDMPMPTMESGSDMGSAGSMGDMGGMGGMARSPDPAEGRYVDNQYQALKAETLRTALRSPTPADAFLVVAKRMPVRMRLVVDIRKLPRLLAQLGNSALPVEVRQVRINRGKDAGGGMDMMGGGGGGYGMMGGGGGGGYGGESDMGSMMPSGGMGMGMGGMGMGMGGMGMGMGGYGQSPDMAGGGYTPPGYGSEAGGSGMGGGYGMGGGSGMGGGYGMGGEGMGGYGMGQGQPIKDRTDIAVTSQHDVPVEIYGIIYIYNPVDEKKLGLESQQPALTGTVPPATAVAAAAS